jgi:hypothetical protein
MNPKSKRPGYFVPKVLGLLILPCLCFGAQTENKADSHDKFLALSLPKEDASCP